MIDNKKITCIIPARLQSTRFPKKILAELFNKPLFLWVWEAASRVPFFDTVIFAIDHEETAAALDQHGLPYIMTSQACQSGTDRLIEVMHSKKILSDIWVNWQCDEPFITQQMITDLLQGCSNKKSDPSIWTLKKRITQQAEILSPHIAKVVCDMYGNALYFSRSPIPFYRDNHCFEQQEYYKHVGIYAFNTAALEALATTATAKLEEAECLEQLRWLTYGHTITLYETNSEVIGIDRPVDLEKAQNYIIQHKYFINSI